MHAYKLSQSIELMDSIELAARDLPERYIINLGVENGAAWVELLAPGTAFAECVDSADLTLAEQIKEAVAMAIAHKKGGDT